MIWYRYEMICYAAPVDEFDRQYGEGTVATYVRKFPVIRETKCGVWLDVGFGESKFVLRDAKRQWASPTEEQAKHKFIQRKRRQIQILSRQIDDIKKALASIRADEETYKVCQSI